MEGQIDPSEYFGKYFHIGLAFALPA